MISKNGETGPGRFDGILLMIIFVAVLGLVLMAGCNRGKAFEEISQSNMPESKEPAPWDAVSDEPVPEAKDAPRKVITTPVKEGPRDHDRIRINPVGNLMEVFNDSNKYQYAAAERLGLRPISGIGDSYFTSRPIVKVSSNAFYTLDSLTHSFPYLVPEAEKCLRDIGTNFIDSLRSRGADSYRILVTSLLRTPYTVKKLRRVNRNAVDSSTHQFGTTFDISFTRFHNTNPTRTINEEDLKNLLAEVLLDMRNNHRCLVKYERKGGCFHITATR